MGAAAAAALAQSHQGGIVCMTQACHKTDSQTGVKSARSAVVRNKQEETVCCLLCVVFLFV